MSASGGTCRERVAEVVRSPSWPKVVRILARQRLMPLSDFLGSAVGSVLVLLAQSAFLSGIDSSGQSVRYVLLARIAFATSGGQYLERYLINGYMSGSLLTSMLAPPDPIGLLAARSIAGALASLVVTLPATFLAAAIFRVPLGLPWPNLVLFLASLAFAWCTAMGLSLITAYLGVALKQDEAAVQLKVFITQLGSGALIPIYLYPKWLQRILSWLPFAHMADTPVAIASGGSPGKLGVQILWAAGLLWVGAALWRRRMRRLDVYGG
ncbi:MAG: ABC transporter permease [Firmicutes bacterium]|nr:ABC transporter permease [Bacillota bacterium]